MASKTEKTESRPLIVLCPEGSQQATATNEWSRLLPAAVVSLVVNALVMVAFLAVNVATPPAPATETGTLTADVEATAKPANLVNDEIGLNPSLETNYN